MKRLINVIGAAAIAEVSVSLVYLISLLRGVVPNEMLGNSQFAQAFSAYGPYVVGAMLALIISILTFIYASTKNDSVGDPNPEIKSQRR